MKAHKKTLPFLLAILLTLTLFVNSYSNELYSPNTVAVKFKKNTEVFKELRSKLDASGERQINLQTISSLSSRLHSFSLKYNVSNVTAVKPNAGEREYAAGVERIFILEVPHGTDINKYVSDLQKENFIEYSETDYIATASGQLAETSLVPNDPQFVNQWGLRNTGQTINSVVGVAGMDINIVPAWDITTGNPNLRVGVLDSGIPLGASEFSGRLIQGYDFANNDNNPTDDHGHGTNVTSIVSAKGNNGSIMAGVNWNSKIIPVKVLDSTGFGQYSWMASGIIYAADSNAKIISMSIGGPSASSVLKDAIDYAESKGTITVVCMMNNNNNVPYYPAAYNNVIAIGAINNKGKRAVPFCWGGGSSFGNHIDFVAPGEMILGLSNTNPNTVNYWCGTSQATPMVAGVISLMLSKNPNLNFTQIYNLLKATAKDTVGGSNPAFNQYYGWGRIDAAAVLSQVPIGINTISTEVPGDFYLAQNFPNPFNPSTKISFGVTSSSQVILSVYDLTGKEVASLVNERIQAGKYEVTFDAKNLPSGTYFLRLNAGGFTDSKKITLIK